MDKIGLIEDDDVLRHAYAKYFQATQTFDVVFSVPDIPDILTLKSAQPDIILLDIKLASGSGLDSIKPLKAVCPNCRIVILSSLQNAQLTTRAIDNGATGFLLKTSSLEFITESLLKLNEGGIPFSPITAMHMVQPAPPAPKQSILTKREMELVKLISEGHANKVVADMLNVTYFTINQHLKNIYKKLHINSKAELISKYLNNDI